MNTSAELLASARAHNNFQCLDVTAVVITFNPSPGELTALLASLLPQVREALVIDNHSHIDVDAICEVLVCRNFSVHRLDKNVGIAAAQNVGIGRAISAGAAYVLLSDQDSEPAPDMVFALRCEAESRQMNDGRLAAVGPCFTDTRQANPPPFIRIKNFRLERQFDNGSGTPVEVDYLIASGCLVPVAAFAIVGLMNESMFIDYVDIEWGLRAKRLGLQSVGVFAASMQHALGDEPIRFLGRSYPARSPVRHYYMVRNAIWMCRQPHVPFQWKVVEGYKLILRAGFYALFARPRLKHMAMMLKGVAHGLAARMGPL